MVIGNSEYYVSLKDAKNLVKVGFNLSPRHYFIGDNEVSIIDTEYEDINNFSGTFTPMPTLDEVQRWLRTSHGMHIAIMYSDSLNEYFIHLNFNYTDTYNNYGFRNYAGKNNGSFLTYEHAQEAAIQKCISLLIKRMVASQMSPVDWVTTANMEAADDIVEHELHMKI